MGAVLSRGSGHHNLRIGRYGNAPGFLRSAPGWMSPILYEENGDFSGILVLSTSASDFLAFFSAFFSAFFAIFDFLIFLAIGEVPPIVAAAS
jgi:hypothetical protein